MARRPLLCPRFRRERLRTFGENRELESLTLSPPRAGRARRRRHHTRHVRVSPSVTAMRHRSLWTDAAHAHRRGLARRTSVAFGQPIARLLEDDFTSLQAAGANRSPAILTRPEPTEPLCRLLHPPDQREAGGRCTAPKCGVPPLFSAPKREASVLGEAFRRLSCLALRAARPRRLRATSLRERHRRSARPRGLAPPASPLFRLPLPAGRNPLLPWAFRPSRTLPSSLAGGPFAGPAYPTSDSEGADGQAIDTWHGGVCPREAAPRLAPWLSSWGC
jgi:hypothetical protein